MSDFTIERLGGLAGFGLPNSKVQSIGRCNANDLSQKDLNALKELFAQPNKKPIPSIADGFSYRITRRLPGGKQKTIEVEEAILPEAIASLVKDELK